MQLHKKTPCTELQWVKRVRIGVIFVRIFTHFDWIRRNTSYLSVFSLNAEKYELELLRIRTLFMQCYTCGLLNNKTVSKTGKKLAKNKTQLGTLTF